MMTNKHMQMNKNKFHACMSVQWELASSFADHPTCIKRALGDVPTKLSWVEAPENVVAVAVAVAVANMPTDTVTQTETEAETETDIETDTDAETPSNAHTV